MLWELQNLFKRKDNETNTRLILSQQTLTKLSMLSDFICIVILPTIYNNLEVLDCVDKNKYNNRSFILHQQTIKDR